MQRRSFLGALGSALGSQRRRPNILFLLTDDQRADLLSCAGHPILRTPNIDSLAQNGVRFVNNFCSTAICCTSRASILTGLHEKSHRISNFATRLSPECVQLSYPHLLRQAGYKTGFVGKYGVGGDGAPPELFDVSHGNPGPERQGQSRELGRQAIDFLQKQKSGESFCLSVSFRAPHARDPDPKQYLYDPEESALYRDVQIPISPKADPKYFERLPASVQQSESRARWNWRFTNPAHYQESVKSYFRLIAGVDAVVGDILKQLNQSGLADNTVVIFSSDNGYFLAERGLADKWYLYEESIRTPLIIRDPRMPARLRGTTRREMSLNLDLSPTFLGLAGLKPPAAVQGRDLTPFVQGANPKWRKEWFYSHLFPATPPRVTIPRSEGLRTERHKYIRWIDTNPLREEVYDLQKDPEEISPLAEGKTHSLLRDRWTRWNQSLAAWTPNTLWSDPK
jgi:arylsulfatase A-like enzyme